MYVCFADEIQGQFKDGCLNVWRYMCSFDFSSIQTREEKPEVRYRTAVNKLMSHFAMRKIYIFILFVER